MAHFEWINYLAYLRLYGWNADVPAPALEDALELGLSRVFGRSKLETANAAERPTCATCQAMFSGALTMRDLKAELDLPEKQSRGIICNQPLHQSLDDIQTAAREGCPICYLKWRGLSRVERAMLRGCKHIRYDFYKGLPRGLDLRVDYYAPGTQLTPEQRRIEQVIFLEDFDSTHGLSSYRFANSVGDASALRLAKVWLSHCRASHHACNAPSFRSQNNSRQLPTRLLRIFEGKVRLCYGKDLAPDTQYCTLSHRWEPHPQLVLKQENEPELAIDVPWPQLNKTFQDAINVCSALGIDYLWIDSLCIIQDSTKDWEFESARMATVYSFSEFTIAATTADNSAGLFVQRQGDCVKPFYVRSSWNGYRPRSWHCNLRDMDRDTMESPLLERAWAWQEVLLSPRILYFVSDRIHWECCERKYSESYPCGSELRFVKPGIHDQTLRYEAIRYQDGMLRMHAKWCKVVDRYSQASLTFPEKDKLIAIAGVARYLGDSQSYLAGLWRANLPRQLLWRSVNRGNVRRPEYNAPTWSWASIHGEICYAGAPPDGITPKFCIDIISATTKPIYENNLYGPVSQGRISLEGSLGVARVGTSTLFPQNKVMIGMAQGFIQLDAGCVDYGREYLFLPVEEEELKEGSCGYYGLVLEASEGCAYGELQRIGFFEIWTPTSGQQNKAMFDELLTQENEIIPCELAHVEQNGRRVYKIVLT